MELALAVRDCWTAMARLSMRFRDLSLVSVGYAVCPVCFVKALFALSGIALPGEGNWLDPDGPDSRVFVAVCLPPGIRIVWLSCVFVPRPRRPPFSVG